jgi:DNA-binding response OmpR family regulator
MLDINVRLAPGTIGRSVLVVDRDPDDLALIRSYLNQQGIRITVPVFDSDAAFSAIRQRRFNLVIYRIDTRPLDAFAFARFLSAQPHIAWQPIIRPSALVVTAETPTQQSSHKLRQAGASGLMRKAATYEEFDRRLRTVLLDADGRLGFGASWATDSAAAI